MTQSPQPAPSEDELAERLRSSIRQGDILNDGRMPPERTLAEHFGVSRARLRLALGLLQEDGTIYRRHGQGTFATPPPATNADSLRHLARQVTPSDVMEVRLEVEPALAALAADRARPQEIERLDQLMRATLNLSDPDAYEAADDMFHYKIAEMARNPLFLTVYESIRAVRREVAWTSRRRSSHAPETLQILGEQHMTLNDAIARRDSLGAASAMEQHLLTVSKTLLRDRVRKIELNL
ncbi:MULTISPECIES: FadR/GntR family transcriptional regulator [Sulfitobacter]|uniref:L-lactate dehydrogenase operon regulatory protein n=1 Tax=Sulfitobacter dubius TaxID=218673 RepID=A0ABY3ZQ63_9RHOB|nr:FCD domain-containing protein [Sulfitobacter dubius]UOA16693.1 Putative L-lactate dehydrogenase operon regulatory protein [Sulfitobacter dubius]WOI30885.1 FCD domain-containing protein [Sulfitobacter dubius]SFH30933.1 transcriptional regulator, GntR family [Sulfitobacter dubius]